jgi:hypothetical protein
LFFCVLAMAVFASVFTGCGKSGGGNGGNGGNSDGPGSGSGLPFATADDYKGTWFWPGQGECPYSVTLTVSESFDMYGSKSDHYGSLASPILEGSVSIDGTMWSECYITIWTVPYVHHVSARVVKEFSPSHNVVVSLSGTLTDPETLSVYSLWIHEGKSGTVTYNYSYESGEHNDQDLLFKKQ